MNGPRASVLVIEDEPEIRRILRGALESEGYRVVESASGRRGTIDAGSHKPDLAIVDLGLPDLDGVEVIRRIRSWSGMPIVVLSARIQERSKIEALDAGADDYVTKPFGVGELLARIRVALRHATRSGTGQSILSFEDTRIDLERRQVRSLNSIGVRCTGWPLRTACLLSRSILVSSNERIACPVPERIAWRRATRIRASSSPTPKGLVT